MIGFKSYRPFQSADGALKFAGVANTGSLADASCMGCKF